MTSGDFFLPDDAATTTLGSVLARLARPGDLVLLEGGLGAGKTALARALIRTLLGNPEADVPSPSFALVQPYKASDLKIVHADLYRLADARELDELGLFEDEAAIVLVEWPERVPELANRADFRIHLALGEKGEGRVAAVTCADPDRDIAAAATAAGLTPVETG